MISTEFSELIKECMQEVLSEEFNDDDWMQTVNVREISDEEEAENTYEQN
jgi:hypothetical protein